MYGLYGVRYDPIPVANKKEEVEERKIDKFSSVGATPLEELDYAERIRVYASYSQTLESIIDQFEIAIRYQRNEQVVNKNRLSSMKKNFISSIVMVVVSVLLFMFFNAPPPGGGGMGVGITIGDVLAISQSMDFVIGMVVRTFIVLIFIFGVFPGLIKNWMSYSIYKEAPMFRRTILKNKMATYYTVDLFHSKNIIELQKKEKKYVDVLQRIKNMEILCDKDVEHVDSFDPDETKVLVNPYRNYPLRARDLIAIIRHKDNWATASYSENVDVKLGDEPKK